MSRFVSSSDLLKEIDGLANQVRARQSRHSPLPDRPAVLVALTDLFASRKQPLGEEIERYEDLALRLIRDSDAASLAHVAARLALHPAAPVSVIDEIIKRGGVAASILLEHCARIPEEALKQAASGPSEEPAIGVARRAGIGADILNLLSERQETNVLRTLALQPGVMENPRLIGRLVAAARGDAELARTLFALCKNPRMLRPLFLQAPPNIRAAILATAEDGEFTGQQVSRAKATNKVLNQWLRDRARQGRWGLVTQELAALTGLPRSLVDKMAADETGEGLALLFAAISMPRADAVRIFLLCPPAISHSTERVFALANLLESLPAFAALNLAEQCAEPEIVQKRAVHTPSYDSGAGAIQAHRISRVSPAHQRGAQDKTQDKIQETTIALPRRQAS